MLFILKHIQKNLNKMLAYNKNSDRLSKIGTNPHIAIDMYVLGQGVKTGVYRVCDELFRRLAKNEDLSIRYLLRASTKNGSLEYLTTNGMSQKIVTEDEDKCSYASDMLLSPFGVAPSKWLIDNEILHAHIIYDLIAIRRPDLFTEEASTEVHKIMDSLTPNTLIFAISEYTRQDLLDYRPDLSPHQIVVIPLGAGEQFKPCDNISVISEAKQRYLIPANAKYILTLATLEVRKNLNRVVEAFTLYMDANPSSTIYLVLAGMSGWKLDSLNQSLTNAGRWRDRIILTGFVNDCDLSAIYSGAECFMYMSQYEGFGLPPLEAMACGTPVICANNSSLPEVVGDAGLLMDANDVQSAADAISMLLKSAQLRSELSIKGLERAKLFSWDKCEKIVAESLRLFATTKNSQVAPQLGTVQSEYSHMEYQNINWSADLDGKSNRPARKNGCASYLGYQNGDVGPNFLIHEVSKLNGYENWPIPLNSLPKEYENIHIEGGLRMRGQLKSGTLDHPLITYITVVRNNEKTLERTILSVQSQTYDNVEHIILDGASTDGTLDIVHRYADKLDYYASESDKGLYNALNKAIPLARGQLICVLNSDDWLEPDAALIAAKHFHKDDGPQMLLTSANVKMGKVIQKWNPAFVHPGSYFMCANVCHNGIYASKSAYSVTGQYDDTYKIAADFKWIMNALDAGVKFIYTAESTVNYSLGGTSGDFLAHSLDCMRVVKDRFPALTALEIRGLYHSFFVFSDPEKKFDLDIPTNYTAFLRRLQAKHANDPYLASSIGWASIVKLMHPLDFSAQSDHQYFDRMKHRISLGLNKYPKIHKFAKNIYISMLKRSV